MAPQTAIVIGTGVAGASTAFSLARRGVAVTMVDADVVGQATAAGAGIIQPWSSAADGPFYDLYAAGADHYDELIARLASVEVHDIGFRRSGALVVNRDSTVLDEVESRVTARAAVSRSIGEVARIPASRARELFPPLGDGFDALHITGGARVDGRTLRAGLLAGSQALGARVVAGTASVAPVDAGGWAVSVGGRPLEADALVIAAGAWTNRLLEPLDRRIQVEPQRGQITHLRVAADTRSWPSVHPVASHYLVAFDDSRVVVGATRETGSGFDPRVTADGQRMILENALSVAPGLADATIIETRVGLRPLADGELPVVGAPQGVDGVFVNAGFGAAGLTMGPLVGDLLAAVITGEASAPPDGFLSEVDAGV
ncbi:FAD-dependent oxidoreductase [Leifsonia lichenia]